MTDTTADVSVTTRSDHHARQVTARERTDNARRRISTRSEYAQDETAARNRTRRDGDCSTDIILTICVRDICGWYVDASIDYTGRGIHRTCVGKR